MMVIYRSEIEQNRYTASEMDVFVRSIYLVHVTKLGKLMASEGVLKTSKDKGSPDTIECEKNFSFPPSLYFYAGRACPSFGDVAFVFRPGIEGRHNGDANPFDTGGACDGKYPKIKNNIGKAKQLVQETLYSLDTWREAFKDFLKAFFPSSCSAYFCGKPEPEGDWGPEDLPAKPGCYEIDEKKPYWKAWTWEVRCYEEHRVDDGLLGWAPNQGQFFRILNPDDDPSGMSPVVEEDTPLGGLISSHLNGEIREYTNTDGKFKQLNKELADELCAKS